MTKVLITGATGNVGLAIIEALNKINHNLDIYAGVRDLEEDKKKLTINNIQLKQFDFADFNSYPMALEGCDILFLLRPPQISDVSKYFKPIIQTCLEKEVKHIVFLSVQGVENSKIIPHHKIEKLIVESKIPYTFLRPAYFMQNFTTTLRNDLVHHKLIYLPAGRAKFTLIDVRDIGVVTASVLSNITSHVNQSYALTNEEKLNFAEMAAILSTNLGHSIRFVSPNLLSFFISKRREKVPTMLILVMIMLHYLPRFQREPDVTDWVQKISNIEPTTFKQFVIDNKERLTV
jgi:uncharacterized protein YbjT (DUF2867 family)